MKPFRERNPVIIGAVAVTVIGAATVSGLNYDRLPFLTGTTYFAYFDEAGGLNTGAPVEVSGLLAGQVQSVALHSDGVLVTFTVSDDIRLGARTEAAIKTTSLLGNKILAVAPRGSGNLSEAIPIERTTSPYQLPDAIGDLTATISGLNTDRLSDAMQTLSQTLVDTPPQLKAAVDGVARFSDTLNQRDAQLRELLSNASMATTVLSDRTDQIVRLIHDTNAVLASLRSQSAALDQISVNITTLAQQIKGFIAENRESLKPALDKLNAVLTTIDNRKTQVQQSIKGLGVYAMSLGESLASGPFFKAYVANLLPGQFVQPFVDAAFSDLGLDPSVLSPSERTDPQVGQPGTPAVPGPYPRTGQGGPPRLTLPDAITGNPGDPRYPFREPLPAPPAGGPPPGPPALAPEQRQQPPSTPTTVLDSDPVEGQHGSARGQQGQEDE
ncbi:MCE family protein [Mycolicibacterium vanbaalenii]|nr:MCE family protein [Mycolicibacterium vanbaalenii]